MTTQKNGLALKDQLSLQVMKRRLEQLKEQRDDHEDDLLRTIIEDDDLETDYLDEEDIDELFTDKTIRYTEGQLLYYNPIIYKNNNLGTLVLVSNTVRLQNVLNNLY